MSLSSHGRHQLDAPQHYLGLLLSSSNYGWIASGGRGPMHNSKVAVICYAVAVGFILAVAFHSPAKLLITADVPASASSAK